MFFVFLFKKISIFDFILYKNRNILIFRSYKIFSESHPQHQPPPALYTNFWFTFLPDIVIDSSGGVMYSIRLKNEHAQLEIADKQTMLEYLARRSNEKKLFVTTLLACLKARALSLRQIRKVFAMLTGVTGKSSASENSVENGSGSSQKPVLDCEKYASLAVTQQEMQSSVLIPLRVRRPSYIKNIEKSLFFL